MPQGFVPVSFAFATTDAFCSMSTSIVHKRIIITPNGGLLCCTPPGRIRNHGTAP